MAVRNWRLNRKVRSELGLKPGFERVNTVERLIEKADELAAQAVGVAERDARIASLEAELARCPALEQLDESGTQPTKRAAKVEMLAIPTIDCLSNEKVITPLDLIPSLTHRQRAMLLVAYSNGEITTTEETDRAAQQLVQEGYLVDLGENHYALPTELARALENRGDLFRNLKLARDPSDLL